MKKRSNPKKIEKNYKNWIKEMHFIPNWLLYIFTFVPLFIIGASQNGYSELSEYSWYLGLISALSLYELGKRYGHAEGYFDGRDGGYNNGENDALAIDEDMEETFDEIRNEQELEKIMKESKKKK